MLVELGLVEQRYQAVLEVLNGGSDAQRSIRLRRSSWPGLITRGKAGNAAVRWQISIRTHPRRSLLCS